MLTAGADRRIEPRHRIGEGGTIALDEHTTIGCLVHDLSASGVRITLPDASAIPEVFLLSAACLPDAAVCRVVWRDDETIGARFENEDEHSFGSMDKKAALDPS